MPIYAFRCDACGHAFDRLQKLSDADPAACPVCQEDTVRRQLTAPAFRLAGSGWYETDFKTDKDKKRNLVDKGDGPAKSDGDKPASDKPETTKPAPAKDSGASKSTATGSGTTATAD